MYEYLPFLPITSYSPAWFWLSNRSLISQTTPLQMRLMRLFAWKKGKLLENSEEFFYTVRSHIASFNMSPLSNGTNWRHQASHRWGKSGPVETRLTGLVATALFEMYLILSPYKEWTPSLTFPGVILAVITHCHMILPHN